MAIWSKVRQQRFYHAERMWTDVLNTRSRHNRPRLARTVTTTRGFRSAITTIANLQSTIPDKVQPSLGLGGITSAERGLKSPRNFELHWAPNENFSKHTSRLFELTSREKANWQNQTETTASENTTNQYDDLGGSNFVERD